VKPVRDDIIENAHRGQIWGFSAPEKVQQWLKPEEFEEKDCEIMIYDKVGPALASNEFKDRVISSIEGL
jgi:hypothetical protein